MRIYTGEFEVCCHNFFFVFGLEKVVGVAYILIDIGKGNMSRKELNKFILKLLKSKKYSVSSLVKKVKAKYPEIDENKLKPQIESLVSFFKRSN